MDIVEKLRLVDCTFWYKPLGHGIDTDLDVPAYELGALSHEAADKIERLREALRMWVKFWEADNIFNDEVLLAEEAMEFTRELLGD